MARRAELFVRELSNGEAAHLLRRWPSPARLTEASRSRVGA